MAYEKSTEAIKKTSDIPQPSELCKCGQAVAVRIISVVNQNTGEEKTGPFSDYGFFKTTSKGQTDWNTLEMRGNWAFQDWINNCVDCWNDAATSGPRKYNDKQVRYAWMWMMGEIAADSDQLSGTFNRIKLTDDQRDTAIEIVNYEARRTNQPGAIPDAYKISSVWGAH